MPQIQHIHHFLMKNIFMLSRANGILRRNNLPPLTDGKDCDIACKKTASDRFRLPEAVVFYVFIFHQQAGSPRSCCVRIMLMKDFYG